MGLRGEHSEKERENRHVSGQIHVSSRTGVRRGTGKAGAASDRRACVAGAAGLEVGVCTRPRLWERCGDVAILGNTANERLGPQDIGPP